MSRKARRGTAEAAEIPVMSKPSLLYRIEWVHTIVSGPRAESILIVGRVQCRPRYCVRASVSRRLPRERVKQRGEGGAGGDFALADQRGNVGESHPADVVRLEVVFG